MKAEQARKKSEYIGIKATPETRAKVEAMASVHGGITQTVTAAIDAYFVANNQQQPAQQACK